MGALVGSAGCLRLSEGGESTATTRPPTFTVTDTATATSAETDTSTATAAEEQTAEPLDRPPGLEDDGVAVFLADAHVNALSRTSFTVSFRSTNLTRGDTNEARKALVGDSGALERWQDGSAIDMYRTADGSYWRQNVGGRFTYGRQRSAFDRQELIRARDLRTLILAGQWNAPEETDDRAFEITADGIGEPAALMEEYEGKELKSYAAEGKVLESGAIAELVAEFSYLHREDERLFKVRVDYRTTDIGSTDASRPDWYSTAVEQAPDVSARITDDGNYVRMEHAGGNAMLPETAVVLYDDSDDTDRGNWGYRDLERPVEAGTTLYLWMEDDRFHWNRGGKPANANPTPLDGRYGFWMHREGAEYFGNIELPR